MTGCALVTLAEWALLAGAVLGAAWSVGMPFRSWLHERRATRQARRGMPRDTGAAADRAFEQADDRLRAQHYDAALKRAPGWVLGFVLVCVALRLALALVPTGCQP